MTFKLGGLCLEETMKKGDYLIMSDRKKKLQIVGSHNGNIVLATNNDLLDEVMIYTPDEFNALITAGKLNRLLKV
jgi:hypothetical protein